MLAVDFNINLRKRDPTHRGAMTGMKTQLPLPSARKETCSWHGGNGYRGPGAWKRPKRRCDQWPPKNGRCAPLCKPLDLTRIPGGEFQANDRIVRRRDSTRDSLRECGHQIISPPAKIAASSAEAVASCVHAPPFGSARSFAVTVPPIGATCSPSGLKDSEVYLHHSALGCPYPAQECITLDEKKRGNLAWEGSRLEQIPRASIEKEALQGKATVRGCM